MAGVHTFLWSYQPLSHSSISALGRGSAIAVSAKAWIHRVDLGLSTCIHSYSGVYRESATSISEDGENTYLV